MADTISTAPARIDTASPPTAVPTVAPARFDTRLIGMLGALALIWMGFHVLSAWRGTPADASFSLAYGTFLTPRNLWNLSVQTASVAVMATGMVLIIVARQIDLSVGSVLGFVGMLMGVTQAELLPPFLAWLGTQLGYDPADLPEIFRLGSPVIWVIALALGILAGMLIGGLQGFIVAFLAVPSFIVTLGGLLIWRGAAWWVASGRTIAPMDETFRLIGGGPEGAIGQTASWIVAGLACFAIVMFAINTRRRRQRYKFALQPLWADALAVGVMCALVVGAVWVAVAYPWPVGIARRYAEANGIAWPEGGLIIPHGIAIPVLILVGVGLFVTFLATRTRFGRYVFAIGGNPEAAELAGINTRWVTVKVFMLMGALVGIGSAISTARLNAATNAQGEFDELYVIAAAVIGGTSLAGGVGTIAGAILGAVLMQSLRSGMVLMSIDTPLQNIVVGIVLVVAVLLDGLYRRRTA